MYYILYDLKTLKVKQIYTKPLTAKVCDNFYQINGIAEHNGELPKNDWLSVANVHEEVEKSKTHIVCDLVAHFYPKIEPSEKELAAKRVKELKKLLDDTDYQAVKYAEGWLTAEEYEPIKMQRQAWRIEINELEKI